MESRNPLFSALKATEWRWPAPRGPDPSDRIGTRGGPIVVKHRISPFVGTDLMAELAGS